MSRLLFLLACGAAWGGLMNLASLPLAVVIPLSVGAGYVLYAVDERLFSAEADR